MPTSWRDAHNDAQSRAGTALGSAWRATKTIAKTKGRFVLSLESPQGTNRFGLLREVLENTHPDPSEVLAGLEAVTAEDVQRVAQDLVADDRLRLALVGPFDDAERFEKLLP